VAASAALDDSLDVSWFDCITESLMFNGAIVLEHSARGLLQSLTIAQEDRGKAFLPAFLTQSGFLVCRGHLCASVRQP